MSKFSRSRAQDGFTLIELIAVIVILGILSATALPRFVNLSGDARYATLLAAKGALNAMSGMLHAKYELDRNANGTGIKVDDVTVPMLYGYPKASMEFAKAAGLNEPDYAVTLENGMLRVVPRSGNGDICRALYYSAREEGLPLVDTKGSGKLCE